MATSTSLRTIWITIRAVNYATNTFNQLIGQMAELQKKEAGIIQQNFNLAKSAMSAGILFQVLGMQIGGVGQDLLNYGAYVMYVITGLNLLQGVLKFVSEGMISAKVPIDALTISYGQLYGTIMLAVGAFILVMTITNMFGRAAGMVTGLALAIIGLALSFSFLKAVLTSGATVAMDTASAIGIAALAGGLAGMAYAGTHQMGTRMIEETGPAMVHRGEVIYNPSTGRPTQIGNDLSSLGGNTTYIDSSLHVETLNTKASKEELNEILRKQGRKLANDQR